MATTATQKSVFTTANHLLERGFGINEITNNMIRKELGAGSLTTITPLLRDWKTAQLERQGLDIEMPEEIKEKAMIFALETWHISSGLAQVKVESKLKEIRDSLREQEEINTEFDAMAEKLEASEANISGIFHQLQEIHYQIEGNKRELDIYLKTNDSGVYMEKANGQMAEIKNNLETLMKTKFNTSVSFK